MLRSEKERVVERLAERLRSTESLMVADYRGLTMPEIDELRTRLLEAGARFTVVKNSLTKLAAEQAGTTDVLQLIEGPTGIAFIEAEGDPVAVAKVLNETARAHDVLVIRGGVLEGSIVGEDEIKRLATLPPADVLRAQLVGALSAPMATVVGVFSAPLRDFVGVLQARIDQLEAHGESAEAEPATDAEPEPVAEAEQSEPEAEEEAPSDGEES
jgi:large subunit ribosomal protein L10